MNIDIDWQKKNPSKPLPTLFSYRTAGGLTVDEGPGWSREVVTMNQY